VDEQCSCWMCCESAIFFIIIVRRIVIVVWSCCLTCCWILDWLMNINDHSLCMIFICCRSVRYLGLIDYACLYFSLLIVIQQIDCTSKSHNC
jgi:hypothetical protein